MSEKKTDELKREFIKEVEAASRHRFAVEVFADMVRAMAIAIESPLVFGERKIHLEAEYEQIKSRYDADEFAHFPRALALFPSLCEWLVENAAKLGIPDMVAKLRERGDKALAALAATEKGGGNDGR